ncbi:MAG: hypothetical protein A2Y10_14640 [Planctomycetes bacterium GWF2_41_51]|nr:MAG: hypothetical protein A2Y10_14640 [Planctomycetes bacterium GWF2_41_51]HBG25483.1 hypothetical protein [Phycisphaerales bacterium]
MNHDSNKSWYEASLLELLDCIEQSHQTVLDNLIPVIRRNIEKALTVDKQYRQMLTSLNDVFSLFADEIESHFAREEELLVPYIRQIDWYDKNNGDKPQIPLNSLTNPISQIEYEHDITENTLLKTMRIIASDFKAPPDASSWLKSLYKGLEKLEQTIHEHIHIENDILFPKAIQTEMTVLHGK